MLAALMPRCTAANENDSVVVSGYELTNAAWTAGTIHLLAISDKADVLSLTFSMPLGSLEMMSIQGKNWVLDLTEYVSKLPNPYPLRSQANIRKMDAKDNLFEFSLALPFGSPEACSELVFVVVDGKLKEHQVESASSAQCAP